MNSTDVAACRKAVIYARIARVEKGSAHRLAEQIQRVKKGLPPDLAGDTAEVYAEIGSGALGFEKNRDGKARPELQRLANDVRQGKVGSVHVADRSRLARRAGVFFRFIGLCEDHGARVFAGNEELGGLGELRENPQTAAMAESAADLFDEFYLRAVRSRRR